MKAKRNVVPLLVLQLRQASTVKQAAQSKSQQKLKEKSRCILELSDSEARAFLLKAESYCGFDLPPYIVFDNLLARINNKLNGREISNFYCGSKKPRDFDDLNHTIVNNKDGKYAWRPLRLLHPALYVALVHKITEKSNWENILKRLMVFRANPRIECHSFPVQSLTKEKDRAEQVSNWWHEVEQRSIEFALDYEYMMETDVTDCYGSIYTHSIAWALHSKDDAKKYKGDKSLIGNIIDGLIQDGSHGQTNGIPQGSVLMDFIAEMVLGYADSELSKKIEEANITDYHILRYRDDYRIFVNNPQHGEKLVKLLSEVLLELGLKLNPSKTLSTNQVVRNSIKPDKLYWIGQNQVGLNLQKFLLIIHNLATQFPNSGSLIVALNEYYDRVAACAKIKEPLLPLISLITDIAYHNPKAYAISSAILSKLISLIDSDDEKRAVVKKVTKRFDQIPNTGHLEIWLQRITITFDKTCGYKEKICQLVEGAPVKIWNTDWLSTSLSNLIQSTKIIDQAKLEGLPPVIAKSEVELFRSY